MTWRFYDSSGSVLTKNRALTNDSHTHTYATAPGFKFVFTQSSPASVWTIVHNMDGFPNVSVVDSSGSVVEGDVTYDTANQVTVAFTAAFSGTAYLS